MLRGKRRRYGLAVALYAASTASFAARPLVTDDARIVDPQSCQLESYVKSNQSSTEYWALPACNPTGNLELTVGANTIRNNDNPNDNHLIVQAKTIFKPLETNSWAWGLSVGVVDATTPHTMSGDSDLYANIPITLSLRDDAVLIHVNAGLDHDRILGQLKFTYGLGTELTITPRFAFVGETYGDSREKPFWQGGGRTWIIPQRWQVDATVGGQFGAGRSGRWVSVGIRLLSDKLF